MIFRKKPTLEKPTFRKNALSNWAWFCYLLYDITYDITEVINIKCLPLEEIQCPFRWIYKDNTEWFRMATYFSKDITWNQIFSSFLHNMLPIGCFIILFFKTCQQQLIKNDIAFVWKMNLRSAKKMSQQIVQWLKVMKLENYET